MVNNNVLYYIKYSQIIGLFSVILIVGLLSIIWNTYFIKQINYHFRMFRDCLKNIRNDSFGNIQETARIHKVDMITNIFLLLINAAEFATIIIYALGAGIVALPNSLSNNSYPSNSSITDCSHEFSLQTLDLKLSLANPIFPVLISISQVGLIFSFAFGICLVKYLQIAYHEIDIDPFKWIKRFLIITSLISIFHAISGSVPQLMIFDKLVEPIIVSIYFIIWLRCNRTFYKCLRWRSIEYRVRGRSETIVRRSVISFHQFAIISSCMSIVYACFFIAEMITQYFFLVTVAIYNGPCLFNYLYRTTYFEPLLNTQKQIDALNLTNEVFSYFVTFFVFTGSALITVEYILASVFIFGKILWMKLRSRFYKSRTRFTPPLHESLLSNGTD